MVAVMMVLLYFLLKFTYAEIILLSLLNKHTTCTHTRPVVLYISYFYAQHQHVYKLTVIFKFADACMLMKNIATVTGYKLM